MSQTLTEKDISAKQHQKELLFSRTPVLKALLKIAIPGLIAMFVFSLYSVADLLISLYFGTGHNNLGTAPLTAPDIRSAMSIAGPLYAFSFALGGMVAIGSISRLGLLLGKHDHRGIYKVLGNSISCLLIVSTCIVIALSALTTPILNAQLHHQQDVSAIFQNAW